MTAMPVAQQMTAEDFLAMPVPQSGRPNNLVDGELIVNEPTATHSSAQGNLLFGLETWCRAQAGRGSVHLPLDVELDRRNVFAPDVAWYSPGRGPRSGDAAPYPMSDLAVEVRSPTTWRYDIGAKKAGYERHALPELWLVDSSAQAVLVFRRSRRRHPSFDVALELDRSDALTSPLLPGFALPVADVFAERRS